MFPFADQLANLLGHPDMAFYVRLMALGIIPGVLYGVFRNILDASYEQKFINILGIGLLLLNFIAMIVFVILANLGLSGYIFVGIIEAILGSCICLYWIMKKFPTLLKGDNEMLGKELKHRVMRYSITSLFFSLASQFISKPSENIFLGIFRKLEEVTYYDVSYTFAQTVLVEIQSVIGSLGLISLVEISTMNLDKIKLAIRQYVKLISLYVIPMSIGGILLAKPIMVVFYGNQMSPAAVPFQAFMILFCLNNLLYINDVILRTYEKISYLLVWRIIGAIVLLILDLLMIPTFGITGAILANFITLLLTGAVYSYESMFRLRLGNFWPVNEIVRYILASSFMTIFIFLIISNYEIENPISLLLIVISGFLLYLFGLKITHAISVEDIKLINKSSIPFKNIILKIFKQTSNKK